MGQSTIQLQELVDDAKSMADLAPALATGGYSDLPALSAANDVMQNMVAGGPEGQPFNWKWNRMVETPFFLNSWQQDYFIPNLVTLGWLESCTASNFSTTQFPKPIRPIEVKRDLLIVSTQMSQVAKICWMQNDTMLSGTWGQTEILSATGLANPGPGVVITNPSGLSAMPINPTTQVKDAVGNLWVVTQYGTCGSFNPFNLVSSAVSITGGVVTVTVQNGLSQGDVVIGSGFTTLTGLNGLKLTILTANSTSFTANTTLANGTDTVGNFAIVPTYPTLQNQTIISTTVNDGTVIWTVVNPKGQGFRINPIPGQTGPVWLIQPVAQNRVQRLTSYAQYLDPIPDDFYTFFKQGFFAQCYRRSPDPKTRAKFEMEYKLWQVALVNAVRQGGRELDDWGFYPTQNVMDQDGYGGYVGANPSQPFGPWCY